MSKLKKCPNFGALRYFTIICSTMAKAQMLNKPYIHYMDVKIMNKSAGGATGLTPL